MDAVIFDWGGTLSVWANPDMEDMWRLAARRIAPDREDELTAQLIAVEARSWSRGGPAMRSTRLAELLAEASQELGVDVAEVVIEEACGHHLESWTPHIRHQPDAAGAIAALRERGLAIGLLSNTHWPRHFHERFLARDGLDRLIDVRLYTSDMDHVKPHPEAFEAVLDALGVSDPAQAMFVGDRLYDDVCGARAVGMKAVWVRNEHTPAYDVEPDGVIEHLAELPALVERLTPVS